MINDNFEDEEDFEIEPDEEGEVNQPIKSVDKEIDPIVTFFIDVEP